MVIAFLHTFHTDHVICPIDSHPDGIEADHLTNGLGHRLAFDAGCDTEVLQVVVEEVDCIARLLVIQLTQGFVKRNIGKLARDALGLTRETYDETGKEEHYSSHSIISQSVCYPSIPR